MAVYVDDMYLDPMGQYRGMKMSHMLADSDEELHAIAARIGVDRRWHQKPPKCSGSHYDIALTKRELAVAAGAIEITMRQAAAMNARRRITGMLGAPEVALEWLRVYRGAFASRQGLGVEPLLAREDAIRSASAHVATLEVVARRPLQRSLL